MWDRKRRKQAYNHWSAKRKKENAITTNKTIGYPGCPGVVAENSSNSNGSYECLSAAANVFTCK